MFANSNQSDKSGADNNSPLEDGGVPQKDSREIVLEFLLEHDYPHQPKDIYGGLIYQGDITFSYRTVQNAVSELVEKGQLRKVEIDEKEGVVRELPIDTRKRAYYVITDKGRERVIG